LSWDTESDDIPQCLDCGRRVDGSKYGPGVSQCYGCAMGEVLEPPKPNCLRCHGPVEKGPLCDGCEAANEAKRERVLRYVQDRWPAILKRMEERHGRSRTDGPDAA
jgi:hypothetical protein